MPKPDLALTLSLALWITLTSAGAAATLTLSAEQHAYLDQKQQIRYCVDPDWPPFEYIEQGQHLGMSADYIQILTSLIQTPFVLVPTETWSEALDKLRAGDCDLIPMLNKTPKRSEYALFTAPYLRDPNVLVVRKEHRTSIRDLSDCAGKTIGAVRSYMQYEFLRQHYPSVQVVPVASELQGIEKVSRGELDAFAGSMLAMGYHIQRQGLANLHIAGSLPEGDALRMAVKKHDTQLRDILSAALASISHHQHSEIYNRWNPISISPEKDYTLAWQVGSVFILLLGILIERYWSMQLLNRKLADTNQQLREVRNQLELKNEHLTHLSRYDGLTGILNRRAMREHIEEDLLLWRRNRQPLCLHVLDLDQFKSINDTYGHQIGDEVLSHFTQQLSSCLRETDRLARWGGEEFLILCRHQKATDAHALAERILQTVNRSAKQPLPDYHCSIGWAEYVEGDTFESWFERADAALYQAKAAGGNCQRRGHPG